MKSCVLFQSPASAITVLDIPRSLEQAQGGLEARLISSPPIEHPYPGVEPKSSKARENLGESSLDELLLQKHLEFALAEAGHGLEDEKTWCLPRISKNHQNEAPLAKKRKLLDERASSGTNPDQPSYSREEGQGTHDKRESNHTFERQYYHNSKSFPLCIAVGDCHAYIPPKSTLIQGDIASTIKVFKEVAPQFDCVIMDPPWPNRSARRKKSYGIAYGTTEIRNLLSLLPIQAHLAEDGLVAVWVTNRSAFREMLLGDASLFKEWGVTFIEEWIWLKVTSRGVPICPIDLKWRKPYEILLVGKRFEAKKENEERGIKRRVIIGVPDLHSRKPNLSSIIEQAMGKGKGTYDALEIFARNATAGWYAWGNEVLKFQMSQHWQDIDNGWISK